MPDVYVCQWCHKLYTWKAAYDAHLPKCIEENEGTENDPLMKQANAEVKPKGKRA